MITAQLENPPDSEQIARRIKKYVALQLGVLTAFSLWVFLLREQHSWPLLLVSMFCILWGITSLGGLLDGRKHAWLMEGVRNGVGTLLVVVWMM